MNLNELNLENGFTIIDNFLSQKDYQNIKHYISKLEKMNLFKHAGIGRSNNFQISKKIRGDHIYWLEPEGPDCSYFNAYLGRINELKICLNRIYYLNLHNYESHLSIYQPGTFYHKHSDQFGHNKSRQISCVYFLNDNWIKDDAGELYIYPKNKIEIIPPIANRFVLFTSDLLHEVKPTNNKRYSITGWLKQSEILPIENHKGLLI